MKKRYALCIGNNNYEYLPKLKCSVNDAESMAEKLQGLGFDIDMCCDIDLAAMIDAISSLSSKIDEYDAVLLFFAGHGFHVDGANLLAPIDFNPTFSPSRAKYNAYRLDDLMELLGGHSSKTKILILDCCREEYRSRGIGGNEFTPMSAPQGTIIAFSTSPGQVAKENDDHGKYTEALLKYIELPHEPIESVFKRVRMDLVAETNGAQTPWEHTSLIGEFYFNPDRVGGITQYTKEVFADGFYLFHNDSKIRDIVEAFKSRRFSNQSAALKKLRFIDYRDVSVGDLFVLGRNIYQAADGNCYDCMNFIDDFDSKQFIPDEAKVHILNGMAYEIFFDHRGFRRRELKYKKASSVLNLVVLSKYNSCSEFLASKLEAGEDDYPIFYLPGSNEPIDVMVKLEQINDDYEITIRKDIYAVDDIIIKGNSCYYNRFGNEKADAIVYPRKCSVGSFEKECSK